MICDACNIDRGRNDRLPMGWTRDGELVLCGACWSERYVLRAITIPVAAPESCAWDCAFQAFRGRLEIVDRTANGIKLGYTTGQYFPTKYRKAACAVVASLIWRMACRDYPALDGIELRKRLAVQFGRGIAKRWFS